ncbi:class I SAM-dependent methyltransferase, partial [Pirellulales bacterium]|nr:class I SAM-dependent methyltransferase [Pirellulales bacterium]
VLDSLKLAEHIPQGQRVLDIGSGGGVPGIVLAICRPDLRVTLCESTQKKARVLHAMVESLSLKTPVAACRAEELLQLQTFDVVVARAVAPLEKLLTWLSPHWDAFDELLLIKGKAWTEERGAARHRGLLKKLELRKADTYESPIGESFVLRLWRRERKRGPAGRG